MTTSREPGGQPAMEVLDRAESLRLIAPGGIGRVGFGQATGPIILPVNYHLAGEELVVFRTAADGPLDEGLRTHIPGAAYKVAFEVDSFDTEARSGWSVLVRGGAWHLTGEYRKRAEATGVDPWAAGDREVYVGISVGEVTGRRIRHP